MCPPKFELNERLNNEAENVPDILPDELPVRDVEPVNANMVSNLENLPGPYIESMEDFQEPILVPVQYNVPGEEPFRAFRIVTGVFAGFDFFC